MTARKEKSIIDCEKSDFYTLTDEEMDVVDKIENQAPKQKPSPAEAQEKERQKRKTEELRKIEEQKILAYIKTIEDTQKRVDEHRTNEAKRLVEEGINLGENGFETLMNYLEILRDRSREELTEKNTAAWITAIQVALNIVSDFQRIDGVLGNTTKTCIKDFQKKHGLRVDGLPGRETIDKFITEARRIQKEKEENEKRTIEQRNTITAKSSISLEEAKFLRAHYKIILPHGLGESEGINLNITSITKEIAAELASCPLRSLRLNKVTSISEEVATELAKHN